MTDTAEPNVFTCSPSADCEDEAHFEVFCPGVLDVLSVGKGDLTLNLSGDSPEDLDKARDLITEMLRKGYAIYVDTIAGPERVMDFDPRLMRYTIRDSEDEPASAEVPASEAKPKKSRKATKKVPVKGSRSTAVGRTAGG